MPGIAWATLAGLVGCPELATADVRPTVVELYTSEGCSSCPPAEAYAAELAQRRNVLTLTFHVTYWDNLGWPDRFGLPQATERQRLYAAALHLPSVFTPQTVIDGRHSFVGSDRRAIERELSSPQEGPRISLTRQDDELHVGWSDWRSSASGDVWLITYRRSAVTAIGRGENSGRTIDEVNVVRSIRPLGRWDGRAGEYRLPLEPLPRDATNAAVLLQSDGQGSIVGAATVALPTDTPAARLKSAR